MNGDSRGGAGRGRLGPLHGAMAAGLLSAALAPGPAAAMDFREVPAAPGCPQVCLVAEGSIDPDTARRFEDLVRQGQFSEGATVALDSLGGRMAVGISLGEAIRKHGFATLVGRYDAQANRFGPGTCASACIFTLMGGVRRSVAAGSRVGVHEVHVDRSPHADPANAAQLLMGLGGDHLRKCGATVDLLILALATPPEEIRWLSACGACPLPGRDGRARSGRRPRGRPERSAEAGGLRHHPLPAARRADPRSRYAVGSLIGDRNDATTSLSDRGS